MAQAHPDRTCWCGLQPGDRRYTTKVCHVDDDFDRVTDYRTPSLAAAMTGLGQLSPIAWRPCSEGWGSPCGTTQSRA